MYVDEFNSRFVAGDERDLRPRRSRTQPRRNRRFETNVVLIALAVIVILTVVVIAAWTSGGGGPSTPPKAHTASRSRSHGVVPLLTVIAKRGSTHVTARQGNASGDVAYDGTVQKGDGPVAIRGTRLWVQISSPENLRVIVHGHTQVIPGNAPRVIVVTARGWRPA